MRQINQFTLVLLAACPLMGLPVEVSAQQSKRPAATAQTTPPANKAGAPREAGKHAPVDNQVRQASDKRARPEPKELQLDPLDPRLVEILDEWEAHSAKIKSLHGKHTRREFNKTFEVEKVSEGEFFLETPDKGRIDIMAKQIKKGEVSTRKGPTGTPFQLQPGESERWVCTGEEILSFNMERKEYTRDEIPASLRGKNIVHSPLPFLFGMKADEARQRFNLTLEGEGKDGSVKIKAIPRMDTDRQNYREAWIILDTKRYIPTHVRLIDPSGLDTIYAFEQVEINDTGFLRKLKDRFQDPYHPSLKGFTLAMPNDIQQEGARIAGEENPARAGNAVNPANHQKNTSGLRSTKQPAPSRTTNSPSSTRKQ
ncbi:MULTISPECIES: hypothetical protein [unclassified Schlesneria]|uniref:hypothetical protein n=1 Tax=Schlesneria TaxID=656899 RepID=UPI002F0EF0C5